MTRGRLACGAFGIGPSAFRAASLAAPIMLAGCGGSGDFAEPSPLPSHRGASVHAARSSREAGTASDATTDVVVDPPSDARRDGPPPPDGSSPADAGDAGATDAGGQVNANATFHRLYPGIHFLNGVRHSIEHGSRNSVSANYDGVAFYYLAASATTLVDGDSVSPSDPASRTSHAYAAAGELSALAVTSSFEGRDDTTAVTATTLDHTGIAAFDVHLVVPNSGCFLRRWYDQTNGRQRARVRVDGAEIGTWYTADANTTHRWAERDYFIPAKFIGAKATAHVEIDPDSGSPPWSVVEYRVLCACPVS